MSLRTPVSRAHRADRIGLGVLGALVLLWGLAVASSYDIVADVHPERASQLPSTVQWLGTDHLGRDVAHRLLLGCQAFVLPGLLAAAVSLSLGAWVGAWSAWSGGLIGSVMGALTTSVAALPRLVVVLLAGTIVGPQPWRIAAATGLACAPELADALRARLTSLQRAEFVLALRAHGVPEARILLWHLLWVNGRGLLLRQALATFGYFLGVETTLSYLGHFGVPEPTPSWGNMLAFEFGVPDGNPAAWIAPAFAIWLVLYGFARLAGSVGLPPEASDD